LLTAPLTGVIIGYLSKYKGELTAKIMNISVCIAIAMVLLATAACTIGSYILIPILYPHQYAEVKQYFIMANLSQVIFFVGSVMTVVLLRFAKSKYQMYITAIYAVSFVAICIPFALNWGLEGFCLGLTLTCLARFLITVFLGYFSVRKNKKSV
jgi:O-antigen/teichoic acid export membrane protein